jgi:hypothetical protein
MESAGAMVHSRGGLHGLMGRRVELVSHEHSDSHTDYQESHHAPGLTCQAGERKTPGERMRAGHTRHATPPCRSGMTLPNVAC